jgi:protein O-mannosyl-transferase
MQMLDETGKGNAAPALRYRWRTVFAVCLALAVVVLGAYLPAGSCQFLHYDDNVYVTGNTHVITGLTGSNIRWAFTSVEAANWHPVTWLSHMADAQVFGLNPRGHHLTSVVIHTFSSLLLLLVLLRCTGSLWQSSFVAALFALHPLHVESVAWVSERKDVLSVFFGFLALFCYLEYLTQQKKTRYYFLCFLCFALSLMSKPMLVTFPLVLLLLDLWPLQRYRLDGPERGSTRTGRIVALVREKIPFFAGALVSGMVAIYAQHSGGTTKSLEAISFHMRVENALVAYAKYLLKTLWPTDLAVLYPRAAAWPLWQVSSCLLFLILISAVALRARRSYPFLTVGWFWFLVTLLPVIGLIQVGDQAMADRYSYFPSLGLFIIAAWGTPYLVRGLKCPGSVLTLAATVVVLTAALLTWRQIGYWRDDISLCRHTLQVTAGNYLIETNMGNALTSTGELEGAIQHYQAALQVKPDFSEAHYNLAVALAQKGDLDAAIREYQTVLRLNPNDRDAHNNLGGAFYSRGDLDGAAREFREVLRIAPSDSDAQNNLGVVLLKKGP